MQVVLWFIYLFFYNCVWGEVFAWGSVCDKGGNWKLEPQPGFFPTLNENDYTNTPMCLYIEYTVALAVV